VREKFDLLEYSEVHTLSSAEYCDSTRHWTVCVLLNIPVNQIFHAHLSLRVVVRLCSD